MFCFFDYCFTLRYKMILNCFILTKHKGELIIVRRPNENPQVSREQGIRINNSIDSNEIRLIGSQGENIGIVSPNKGLN